MSKDDGGPAFPSLTEVEQYSERVQGYIRLHVPMGGMSLRDYFAGQALARYEMEYQRCYAIKPEAVARDCYEVADAMLTERAK